MPNLTSCQAQLTSADFAQLAQQIAQIFEQTQNSTVHNDIKNHVTLYGLHKKYASHKVKLKGRERRAVGELRFLTAIQDMIQRCLPVKKGVASADRAINFTAGYIKFINEKANESVTEDDMDEEDEEGNFRSRFTSSLLRYLLSGFLAKDKIVRYRVLQLVAEMTSHLGEIDYSEDLYDDLRTNLIGRTTDKECNIRVQAVKSLTKLSSSEDTSDLNGEPSIMEVLLENLAYDPSAEVRRVILCDLPKNSQSLPAMLERLCDTDTNIRKTVYNNVLIYKDTTEDDECSKLSNDFGQMHPRALTVSQREVIVRRGLGDRELPINSAASKLISTWIDAIEIETKGEEMDVKANVKPKKVWETILPVFLTLFDLVESSTTAADALLDAFKAHPDIITEIQFNDHYWRNLTPQKAFLARVFVEHCRSTKNDARLETTLPDVIVIAFQIQSAYNMLSGNGNIEMADVSDDDEHDSLEDAKTSQAVIISELLKLAVHLDYSDESGRQNTLQLIREMLDTEDLPEKLIAPCLDVLRTVASSERDFIRLVVEAIEELRGRAYNDEIGIEEADIDADTSIADIPAKPTLTRKSRQEMSAEQRMEIDQVDLKCLNMSIEMFERVNGTFEENSTLDVVLNDLIYPAVRREDSMVFREKGLKSLGLCCTIARRLALQSFGRFIRRVPSSSGAIKTVIVQSLFDIVMVHESTIFKNNDDNVTMEIFTEFMLNQILTEEDPKIKALLCMGTAKLVISGTITTVETVKVLLKVFLSPLTTGNQELRQYLDYFFQVYSFSSHENQKRMSDVFVQVFLDVSEDRRIAEEIEEDIEVIGSSQVAAMFVAWTDPLRLTLAIEPKRIQNSDETDDSVQLGMAESVIRLLFGKGLKFDIQKEDKKVLCQLLNKLHVPDVVDDYRIRSLKILMDNLKTRRPLKDNVCLNAFNKFEANITKKFERQLEGFTELEFRELEELTELFEFLDSIIPLDDDEYLDIELPKKGKKRRSHSFASTNESRPESPIPMGKPKIKRPRLSKSGDEDGILERGQSPKALKRTVPRRAASPTKFTPVIVISSDSEEEPPAPKLARSSGPRPRTVVKEEPIQIDDVLISGASSLSLGEVTYDSIMDPDSEEEEEEVNDLLADSE